MASITLISISLNALWSKNVGLKTSDQDYICCTEDAETGSPAQSVVVRGNYSQLVVYCTSGVECYFSGRGEWKRKRRNKPTEKRRNGRSSDEHPPWAAGATAILLSLQGCPGWPRDLPQALSHLLFLWTVLSALIRACRECSVLAVLCSPSWVSSGQPELQLRGGESSRKGQSWPLLVTPQENPCVCWGEAVGIIA